MCKTSITSPTLYRVQHTKIFLPDDLAARYCFHNMTLMKGTPEWNVEASPEIKSFYSVVAPESSSLTSPHPELLLLNLPAPEGSRGLVNGLTAAATPPMLLLTLSLRP